MLQGLSLFRLVYSATLLINFPAPVLLLEHQLEPSLLRFHAQQHYLVRTERYAQEKRPNHSGNLIDPDALTTCDMAFIQGQASGHGTLSVIRQIPIAQSLLLFLKYR